MRNHLTGVLDLHVHAAPDIRPRKLDGYELAGKAQEFGLGGFLLKNHHAPTVGQAAALQRAFPQLRIYGGLVLNYAAGGVNPEAAECALKMGAAEIWMPTRDAEQERRFRKQPGTGIALRDREGRLKPAVHEILRLIAEFGAILGTGHLSPEEIAAVVRSGREAGVRKFLITHPEIEFLNLSPDFQRELSGPGVYFERCYARPGFALDWDGLAAVIRRVGVESTVLATDLGQPENPDPVEGMAHMLEELEKRGLAPEELHRMTCRNPASLLEIE